MSQTTGTPQGSLDILPLADRLRWMLAVRVGVVLLPLAAWVATRTPEATSAYLLVVPGAVLLAVGLVLHRLSVRGRRWAIAAITVPVILDAVHLGWALYLTGGITGPVVYLIVLHVLAVTLLGSFRSGLKIALWHSLVVMCVLEGISTGLLPAAGGVEGFDKLSYSVFLTVVWVTAVTTAGLGAVNERELRRRRYDLEALAAMATQLEDTSDSVSVAETVLASVGDTFGFERTLLFAAQDDGDLTLLAYTGEVTRGVRGPPPDDDSALQTAMSTRKTQLVSYPDVDRDPWLSVLVPGARNVVIVPLSAEGHAIGAVVAEHGMRRGSRIERRVVSMAERFASHGALALRNAWLLERVQELAATDALTGVANRYSFQQALEGELERAARATEDVSLAMLDIDRFKRLNDAHGHQVGDEVLRRVSAILSEHCRKYDMVARYGGEEFAIILPATGRAETRAIIDRLRRQIEAVTRDPKVTISGGVASFPTDAVTVDDLVAAADEALYESKRGGRNRVTTSTRHLKAAPAPRLAPITDPPPTAA
jgi:two-component system, cell cycle response regulator